MFVLEASGPQRRFDQEGKRVARRATELMCSPALEPGLTLVAGIYADIS